MITARGATDPLLPHVDGVSIAYADHGGGPTLVKAANWLTHLEFDWRSPVRRHWLEELARGHRVVRYDERGCGLSDREVEEFSLDGFVADLEAVVDAAQLERFALLGLSQGGVIAVAYAVRQSVVRVGWGRPDSVFGRVFTSRFVPDGTPEQLE
jgi:pimeloyl-ACP methyl ester carboxylesterase